MTECPKDFSTAFGGAASTVHPNQDPVDPSWKRPEEVMALHRLRLKKRALQARINKTTNKSKPELHSSENCDNANHFINKKRRNPFARDSEPKRIQESTQRPSIDSDASTDNTLFKLLSMSKIDNILKPDVKVSEELPSIVNTLTELTKGGVQPEIPLSKSSKHMPIDWSLKTKIRIISHKPFKWTNKLRTSEEASGVTGFVRCLDTTTSESLDTSMSARRHQCCLVWQHPSLPWLQLFPRSGRSRPTNTGFSLVANHPETVKSLHSDWAESFRSLFQLVRAKQCPYFYVCANSFTILFRAAGISGFSETHAFLTPTTRGLRQTLKQEDIEYTMPLKKSNRNSGNGSEDLGYETLDSNTGDSPKNKPTNTEEADIEEIENGELDDDDDINEEQWLKSLGVEASFIKKINSTQTRKKHVAECSIDNSEQSLVCVEGVEAQALFNFLMNCKSAVAITGPLAGIPPTLLAPVAFRGATLQTLKVRESKVSVDNSEYYSMEVCGPILPHTVHSLGSLLSSPDDEYSATFANLENTISFSEVHATTAGDETTGEDGKAASVVFGQENLTDCGLHVNILKLFCSRDPKQVQIIESLKFIGSEHSYTWT